MPFGTDLLLASQLTEKRFPALRPLKGKRTGRCDRGRKTLVEYAPFKRTGNFD